MGSLSIWHWLIVLVIVMLIFGTKKLRNIGQDLGGAVKGFKDGIKDGEAPAAGTASASSPSTASQQLDGKTIDVEAKVKDKA